MVININVPSDTIKQNFEVKQFPKAQMPSNLPVQPIIASSSRAHTETSEDDKHVMKTYNMSQMDDYISSIDLNKNLTALVKSPHTKV